MCSTVSSVDLGFALEEKRARNCFYGDRNSLGCSRVLRASIWGDSEGSRGQWVKAEILEANQLGGRLPG